MTKEVYKMDDATKEPKKSKTKTEHRKQKVAAKRAEEAKRPVGRPPEIVIDDKMIRQVEIMAGLGMKQEDIARVLGMHHTTLWEKFKECGELDKALKRGEAKASMQVTESAFKQAVSGKNPAMTMFWLKCRQRWKEVQQVEMTGEMKLTFATQIGDDGVVRRFEEKKELKDG